MPEFSERSLKQLATCDPRLVKLAERVIQIIDFTVLEGHRDKEGQDQAFAKGTTQVPWPKGKHNSLPSRAMDVAPHPIDFSSNTKALERFVFLQGIFKGVAYEMGIKVRFGLDWDSDNDMRNERFRDYPHIELVD